MNWAFLYYADDRKETISLLYQDWDIHIVGKKARITPMTKQDDEAYGRIMYGSKYDSFFEVFKNTSFTGIDDILNHKSSEETHALRPLNNEKFIGWIALQKDNEGRMDIGISIADECQNQGIGPEAVMLFCNRLYEVYNVQRVYVHISEDNIQSQRAFAKVGAVFDQSLPNYYFVRLAESFPEGSPERLNIPNLFYYHIDLPITTYLPKEGSGGTNSTES